VIRFIFFPSRWCAFADVLTIPDWLNLFNHVAGYGWGIEDLMKA